MTECIRCEDGFQKDSLKPCYHCDKGKRVQYEYDKINLADTRIKVSMYESCIAAYESKYGKPDVKH